MTEKKSYWRDGFLPSMKNLFGACYELGIVMLPFILTIELYLLFVIDLVEDKSMGMFASMFIGFILSVIWMNYRSWKKENSAR